MSTAPVLMMPGRNVADPALKKKPEAAVLEFQRSLKGRCGGGGAEGVRAVRGRCNGSPSVLPPEENPHMRKERACMGHPVPKGHPSPEGQRLYLVQAAAENRGQQRPLVTPRMAFYRKRTEGMLRRYVRMSMEAGRVPSMLSREMFRAKVTNYVVHGFDDVVIFVCDVERCVKSLDELEQKLLRRIAMQEYTQTEVAEMLDMSERTVMRRYNEALDALTAVFLNRGLLQRISC